MNSRSSARFQGATGNHQLSSGLVDHVFLKKLQKNSTTQAKVMQAFSEANNHVAPAVVNTQANKNQEQQVQNPTLNRLIRNAEIALANIDAQHEAENKEDQHVALDLQELVHEVIEDHSSEDEDAGVEDGDQVEEGSDESDGEDIVEDVSCLVPNTDKVSREFGFKFKIQKLKHENQYELRTNLLKASSNKFKAIRNNKLRMYHALMVNAMEFGNTSIFIYHNRSNNQIGSYISPDIRSNQVFQDSVKALKKLLKAKKNINPLVARYKSLEAESLEYKQRIIELEERLRQK